MTCQGYTARTRDWLEQRFRVAPGTVYVAHQPIYGVNEHVDCSEPDHLGRAAKTFQLLRVLAGLRFSTLLDLGAAEGYTGALARELFGAESTVSDLSSQAMQRARDLFDLPAVTLN